MKQETVTLTENGGVGEKEGDEWLFITVLGNKGLKRELRIERD